jgi:hypothetical protein
MIYISKLHCKIKSPDNSCQKISFDQYITIFIKNLTIKNQVGYKIK